MSRSLGTTAILAMLIPFCIVAHGQEPPTMETVAVAWKARDARVKSFEVEWKERQLHRKGWYSDVMKHEHPKQVESARVRPGQIIPATDVTFDVAWSFALQETKFRIFREVPNWDPERQALVPRPMVSIYDGIKGLSLDPEGSGFTQWPEGVIDARAMLNPMDELPILAALKPCSPYMSIIDPGHLKWTGQRSLVQGSSCFEIQSQRGSQTMRVWVDSQRDWNVVRLHIVKADQVTTSIEISHRSDKSGFWVPEKWTKVTTGLGSRGTVRATMTRCAVNCPIEDSRFDLSPPRGAYMTDYTRPLGTQEYIVRKDGSERIVMRHERAKGYYELLGTTPGSSSAVRFTWPLIGTGIVGFGAAFSFWLRARRRSKISRQSQQ